MSDAEACPHPGPGAELDFAALFAVVRVREPAVPESRATPEPPSRIRAACRSWFSPS